MNKSSGGRVEHRQWKESFMNIKESQRKHIFCFLFTVNQGFASFEFIQEKGGLSTCPNLIVDKYT